MKNSFKIMLAVAMLFTATLSANAQLRKKVNSTRTPDRFHMGLRAGLTASTITGDYTEAAKALLFPYGGLGLDFQVAPIPLFVGIGLNYMNMGYKVEYNYNHKDETKTWDAHSIQMPITVKYHINLAPNLFLQPFLGPWFAYNLTDIDEENKDWNDDRFDYGLRFGCGLNYGRLYFDCGYDLGLKNWYDRDGRYKNEKDYTINRGVLFVTFGFNWAGER